MKRNMDLIRAILIRLEEHEHGYAPRGLEIPGFTEEEIGYHCFLLNDAGLINADDDMGAGSPSPSSIPMNLTWSGHEFIVNAKNENIWGQAKEAVKKLGDVSLSVWTEVLTQIVKNNLGIGN